MTVFGQLGYYLAIVSNRRTGQLDAVKQVANGCFNAYFGIDSAPTLKPKPDPSMIIHASAYFGVEPDQCLLVDDSRRGLMAGRQAGCYTLGVGTGELNFDELVQLNTFGHVDDVIFSFARPLPLDTIRV